MHIHIQERIGYKKDNWQLSFLHLPYLELHIIPFIFMSGSSPPSYYVSGPTFIPAEPH